MRPSVARRDLVHVHRGVRAEVGDPDDVVASAAAVEGEGRAAADGLWRGIRGERAAYEITYEEMKENMASNVMHMIAIEEQERDAERQPTKPDGMTKLQWQKESRNKKRLIIEQRKEGQSDWNLKRNLTPFQLFSKRLDKISCRCEAGKPSTAEINLVAIKCISTIYF